VARYDLYQIDSGYVIDLQNDLVDIPGSRIVAPVVALRNVPAPIKGLHPRVSIDGEPYLIAMHLLAAAPTSLLKTPLANYLADGADITRGLDILFQGY
tara:strand:- start:511 stop:804 length:294 start_codon:yes stop_codon:yes gene_type:complete